MSNNELHWKDQEEEETFRLANLSFKIHRLKIELADLVVGWEDSDNTKEVLEYYQKRRNLINQIKELEA